MLEKLTIQNVALIERAEIEFGPGLNILSGETGAGKSVILDSINFVLGAKADRSMIRYGEDACSVRAVFRTEGSGLSELLRDMDIEADDELIVSRRLRTDGRGDIRVNGESVNAAMLRRLTARLVDVHGQSEHFYLLSEANQLALIDRMAGERLQAPKGQLAALLAENRALAGRQVEIRWANDAYAQYFIGSSYLNPLTAPGQSPVPLANVTFEPGCRNNWHIHHAKSGGGQILICTAGEGWYQEDGKKAVSLTPGTVVTIPAEVKHWHGAKKDSWFSHIAVEVPGEETSNEWCEPVDDAAYRALE